MHLFAIVVLCHGLFTVVDLKTIVRSEREIFRNEKNDEPTQLPGTRLIKEVECVDAQNSDNIKNCTNKTNSLKTDQEVGTLVIESNNSVTTMNPQPESSTFEWHFYNTSCMQDDIYNSLESCMYECSIRHTVDDNQYTLSSRKNNCISHKVIVLTKSDYTIDKDKNLIVKGLKTFTEKYYISHDSSVFLCLPLEKCFGNVLDNFGQCRTHLFFDDEYERKGRRTWIQLDHRYFEIDQYYFHGKFLITCDENKLQDKFHKTEAVNEIGYVVSAVFLAITVVIVFVSAGVKKRYNRPLQCYVVMLFLGYTMCSVNIYVADVQFCGITGFLIQYFFLSAFFWVNSQAIDLYISLNDLQPTNDANKRKHKRFIIYCIYAWGLPAFITGMTLLVNLYGNNQGIFSIRILQQCWFRRTNIAGAFIFHYGWIATTLLINIVIFILIMKKFKVIGRAVLVANRNIYKQLFSISVKLVILMGFCWIVKLVVWANQRVSWELKLADAVVTSFHGIFVFLIYSFKVKHLPLCFRQRIRRMSFYTDDSRFSSAKSSFISSIVSFKEFTNTHVLRNSSLKSIAESKKGDEL